MIISDGLGKKTLDGINTPYLYVGGLRTMFACHTEDYDLSSINYNHYGKPKFWYCVSPKDVRRVEAFVKAKYPEAFVECPEYMRHKTVLVDPYQLKNWNPSINITKFTH